MKKILITLFAAMAAVAGYSQNYLYITPELPYQLTQDNKQFLLPLDLLILNNSPVRAEVNEIGQWTETHRYVTNKDNNNYITFFNDTRLDFMTGNWITETRYEYKNENIDANGNLLHYNYKTVIGKDSIQQEIRNVFQNGQIKDNYTLIKFNYNGVADKNQFKTSYGYVDNKLDSTLLYFSTDSINFGTLLNMGVYNYNSKGNVSDYYWLVYRQFANVFQYESAKAYTYTANNKIESVRNFTGKEITLTDTYLDSFYYNSAGKLSTFSRITWDTTAKFFNRTKRFNYTYDNNQNLVEVLIINGSTSPAAWVETEKLVIQYDNQGKPTIANGYFRQGNGWATTPASRMFFNGYKTSPSNVQQIAGQPFQAYPNPANNLLTIAANGQNFSDVAVFDVIGKKLLQQQGNENGNAIDVSNLENGIYYLSITGETGQVYKIKFVKE